MNPIAAAVLQQRLTALRRATPIVFVRSSPAVSAGASRALDDIASALVLAALPVRIEAHSDGTGSALKNLQLSTERANAVRLALIGRGVPANLLTAVGRGDAVPVGSDATARGRELNRRIEFVVLLTRPT